jgi:hypothetical protein
VQDGEVREMLRNPAERERQCGADERAGEDEVDGSVNHVPGRTGRDEIDVGAGDGADDTEEGGDPAEGCEGLRCVGKRMNLLQPGRVDCVSESRRKDYPPGTGCEESECGEEESEAEDLAAEPGALPHLEGPPGIGGTAEVKDGDIKCNYGYQ